MTIKFCFISDTHNCHDELTIPECDMILHCGDSTGKGAVREITEFCEWYGNLSHKYKILIAGNHDWGFQEKEAKCRQICEDNGIIYLQDELVDIEGLRIYGSPWQPEFCDWAFNAWRTKEDVKRNDLYGYNYPFIGDYWEKIPKNLDILLTHGPPYDIMDKCPYPVGCEELLKKVREVKPKYHAFGHIHCDTGEEKHGDTVFINAAMLTDYYRPMDRIVDIYEIDLTNK